MEEEPSELSSGDEDATNEELDSNNGRFLVATGCSKAWQYHTTESHTYTISFKDPTAYFFGIFDGHGSEMVAQYAHQHLLRTILQHPDYKDSNDIENALKMSFVEIDYQMMMQDIGAGEVLSGTAAVLVVIQEDTLYCANVGNTKAIVSVAGQMELLTVEPRSTAESPRLYRMLGDFELKIASRNPENQLFTANPDVTSFHITNDWEFVLLACDGVWGGMNESEVLEFCRQRIGQSMQPKDIITELINYSLGRKNIPHWTGDATIIIVCLLQRKPYSQLVARCQLTAN